MKTKIRILAPFLLVFTALLAGGCFLFEFPYEYDNPLDPNFKSAGTLELILETGQRLYESRSGISYTSAMDLTPDGSYLLIGDAYKPEIMVYNVAGSSESYINFGAEAQPVVDIAAVSGEAYVATANAVFRVDLASNAVEQVGTFTDFEILYYDIDTQDAVGYMITKQQTEEFGETYQLRWYDENGNELGSAEGDLFRDVAGFTVSADYLFLSSNVDHCINVLSQSNNGLAAQIFYNGTDIEQIETSVRSGHDSNYEYYDLNWDPAGLQLAAVIAGIPGMSGDYVACVFPHSGTLSGPLLTPAGPTEMENFSDWHFLSIASDASNVYAADAVFRKISRLDTVSGTVLFSAPAAEDGEFLRVSDMEYREDGTYFLVDERKWTVSVFTAADGTWGSVSAPGQYTSGSEVLTYPVSVGANAERTYIAMRGGGTVLQAFDSAGVHIADMNIGSGGYENISDIELFDTGDLLVWDGDNRNIGFLEFGGPDKKTTPFDFDTVRSCDLEIYGGRTYAAVNDEGESVIGYFTGTDFSAGNFTIVWRSGEENFFALGGEYSHQPFFIERLAVTENGIWAVFPGLAAAAKFTLSGDLVGSVCIHEGFEGARALPGRLYNYRDAGTEGPLDVAIGGFTALETAEDGVPVDYLTLFDNSASRLRRYRITLPPAE